MAKGGARNRSGPPPDPKSERSEKLGRRFGKLPRAGYTGPIPAWPLTTPATTRERKVWTDAWRKPQAAAWATESWRHRAVAMWVRLSVRLEEPDAPASLAAQVIRFADQIGMTPAGLRENGWEIEEAPGSRVAAEVEPGAPAEPAGQAPAGPVVLPRDRLTVVAGGNGGA